MLVGHVHARHRTIVRPAEMRIVVRVADGNVDERNAHLHKPANQLDRLSEVGHEVIVAVYAEAIRVRDGVVDVHPRGHEQPGNGLADLLHRLPQQARTVLQRAAVLALAGVGSQQLGDQVAVTALDVHRVEAGPGRQLRRLDVRVLEAVEVLVGHQGIVVG